MGFRIDVTDVIRTFNVPRDRVRSITENVVVQTSWAVYSRIHEEANRNLKSTRQLYTRNIQMPEFKSGSLGVSGSITLTGMLPNMIEQGAAPFDIKAGFARSAKKKMKKDGGWYMTIPFRHASAGSIGESESFANVMSNRVYEVMKNKAATTTSPNGAKVRGGAMTMNDLYKSGAAGRGFRGVISKKAGGGLSEAQRAEYTHKSPIALGMIRQEKTYENATQSTYMTFRRVSDMSAANSWIHRGFVARDFMPKAMQDGSVMKRLTETVQSELASMGL